jgi:hypothetical protein
MRFFNFERPLPNYAAPKRPIPLLLKIYMEFIIKFRIFILKIKFKSFFTKDSKSEF